MNSFLVSWSGTTFVRPLRCSPHSCSGPDSMFFPNTVTKSPVPRVREGFGYIFLYSICIRLRFCWFCASCVAGAATVGAGAPPSSSMGTSPAIGSMLKASYRFVVSKSLHVGDRSVAFRGKGCLRVVSGLAAYLADRLQASSPVQRWITPLRTRSGGTAPSEKDQHHRRPSRLTRHPPYLPFSPTHNPPQRHPSAEAIPHEKRRSRNASCLTIVLIKPQKVTGQPYT